MSCTRISPTLCVRHILCALILTFLLLPRPANAAGRQLAPHAPLDAPVVVMGDDAISIPYATLRDAFAAINAGVHGGAITVSIQGDTTETGSAVLNASGTGGSNYTSILIRPVEGHRIISGVVVAPLIDLNGADNVTFDGRGDGTGSDKALTLENRNLNAPTLRFVNDATGNVLRYVNIRGANIADCTATTAGGVISFGGTSGTTGNDGNTIETSDIGDASTGLPRFGVCSIGTASTTTNSENIVSGNHIFNFWNPDAASAGIQIPSSSNTTGWIILDNDLYQTGSRSAAAGVSHYGIHLGNGSGYTVTGNIVGGSGPDAQGAPWIIDGAGNGISFTPIRLVVSTTPAVTSVQGNTVANVHLITAKQDLAIPGAFCGIHLVAGAADVGTVTGNVIGSATTAGSIDIQTSSGSGSFGICSGTTGASSIASNTVSGITVSANDGGASSLTGIGITGSGVSTITNNTIGSVFLPDGLNAASASTGSSGQSITGISREASGAATITNNTIVNLNNNYAGAATSKNQSRGIYIASASGAVTISGNRIGNISSSSAGTGAALAASVIGIHSAATSAPSTEISDNTIHSLVNRAPSAAPHVAGLAFNGTTKSESLVARNLIHSLEAATNVTSATITGIHVAGGTTLFANNMLRLGVTPSGAAITTGLGIYGLRVAGGTNRIYHNTVYIGGAGVGEGVATAAFYRTGTGVDTYLNNLWANRRSNGAGTAHHYATWLASMTGLTPTSCNYSMFDGSGSGSYAGRLGATDYGTLADWQAGSGCDANGVAGVASFVNGDGPASLVDLHVGAESPGVHAATTAAGVTQDFDREPRSDIAPGIGADERVAGSYNTLAVATGQVVALTGATTVNGSLVLHGKLDVGPHTLTLGPAAQVEGAPFSAANMILANGGGQVCKQFAAAGAFVFPIGDDEGDVEYAPATLDFASATFAPGAQACAGMQNAAHPAGDQAHYATYLNRYWSVRQTGISDFTCSVTFQYNDADLVVATGESEDSLYLWRYGDAWERLDAADAGANLLTGAVTSFSDFTGRSAAPLAVDLAFLRAERDGACIKLVWETVSERDTRGFYIYRGEAVAGLPQEPLSGLVPASPGATLGQSYAWVDCQVETERNYYYWLEEVALNGAREVFGPVEMALEQPTAISVSHFEAAPVTLGDVVRFVRAWIRAR